MREILFLITLIIASSFSRADYYDECRRLSGKHMSINLLPATDTPSFYVRSINYSFFILFRPEDVLSYLISQDQLGTTNLFVKKLSSELPLKRSLDLNFYVLSDNSIDRTINIMASNLLRQGKAAVVNVRDIWPNPVKSLSEINIYKVENDFSGMSFFCTKEQETVFFILDYIS
jgi:hypothetical protein